MPCRLPVEKIVTTVVLADKGSSHCQIARTLGVAERSVRNHLRRQASAVEDGRRRQVHRASELGVVIDAWRRPSAAACARPMCATTTSTWGPIAAKTAPTTRCGAGCGRSTCGRCCGRTGGVETPLGAQTHTGWGENPRIDRGDGPEWLSAYLVMLSHPRKPSMLWCRGKDLLVGFFFQYGGYRRIGGVAPRRRSAT